MKIEKLAAWAVIVSSIAILGTLFFLMVQNRANLSAVNADGEIPAPDAVVTKQAAAHPLSWMAGCWETEDGSTREYWASSLDTHMLGASITTGDGKVQFFEHMRIVLDGEASVFSAYPNGEGPSNFPGIARAANSITFENTAHDYPQRIKYAGDGQSLTGTISLADGTKPNAWRYTRCGG